MQNQTRIANWIAAAAVALAIGAYYLWQLRAAGEGFDFALPHNGYYNFLGRAFAHGHLYLPLDPTPELLAVSNPWDPSVDEKYKMHDMAYFHQRYYLYHGAAPAVVLFTPWLLLTGHDLPERFAMFLFVFGGFLFSCCVLARWLAIAGARPGPAMLALLFLALGLCNGVPYLLNRVAVYEIAIGGGYFFVSGALFFLTLGVEAQAARRSAVLLAISGVMFGAAIASRPHLGVAGGAAMVGLWVLLAGRRRRLIPFAAAFLAVASLVPLYNYERFGNPFEFGIRYLLTGPVPIGINLSPANLPPGFYFWLVCPPDFSFVFPWVRLVFRYPWNSLAHPFPHLYFIEAMTGVAFVAPFAVAALFPRLERRSVLLWTTLVSAAGVLLFLMLTGFSTQRYETDFLPMTILVALVNLAVWSSGRRGWIVRILTAAAIAFGAVVGLALAIQGPYGEMLRTRPVNYVRVARWFSPVEKYRPILNPEVNVTFTAQFHPHPEGYREPLVIIGNQPYRYFLFAEHIRGGLRFYTLFREKVFSGDFESSGDLRAEIRVAFHPETGEYTVEVNGRPMTTHQSTSLIVAPAEITLGQNYVEPGLTQERFSGQLTGFTASIQPSESARAKGVDVHD